MSDASELEAQQTQHVYLVAELNRDSVCVMLGDAQAGEQAVFVRLQISDARAIAECINDAADMVEQAQSARALN